MNNPMRLVPWTLLACALAPANVAAQCNDLAELAGRWDLTVAPPEGSYPSWLEVTRSGRCTLVGRFVGRSGSARPIGRVEYAGGILRFAIPPQWETGEGDLRLEARRESDGLAGTITMPAGESHPFTARRAPVLLRDAEPRPDNTIVLFNGRDLEGWTTTPGDGASHWRVIDGTLTNTESGANLRTTSTFEDFRLQLEFRYPAGGNSGVYLRGRYEVQVEDTPRRDWPEAIDLGGIYGFIAPNQLVASRPGEWHAYDITLIGRRVTVVLDGRTLISDQVIPGITGGALDSREGEPGPILLQGDHTAVEYRNIRLTPLTQPPGKVP